jgi:hypothetical protein
LADEVPKNLLSGDVIAISDGEIVVDLKGLQMSSIGDREASGQDPHAGVELE